MIIKQHVTPDKRLILAICDDELLGKTYCEGKKQLNLSSDFYRGTKVEDNEARVLLIKAYAINAVGKAAVSLCIKAELAEPDNIRKIKGVPFLLLTRC
jgi:hypothetical protein